LLSIKIYITKLTKIQYIAQEITFRNSQNFIIIIIIIILPGSQNYITGLTKLHNEANKIILPGSQNYITGFTQLQNYKIVLVNLHCELTKLHKRTKLHYRDHKITLRRSNIYYKTHIITSPLSQDYITRFTKLYYQAHQITLECSKITIPDAKIILTGSQNDIIGHTKLGS
jgi:hypothetical protein